MQFTPSVSCYKSTVVADCNMVLHVLWDTLNWGKTSSTLIMCEGHHGTIYGLQETKSLWCGYTWHAEHTGHKQGNCKSVLNTWPKDHEQEFFAVNIRFGPFSPFSYFIQAFYLPKFFFSLAHHKHSTISCNAEFFSVIKALSRGKTSSFNYGTDPIKVSRKVLAELMNSMLCL